MDNKDRKNTTTRQKYSLVFLPIISAAFFVLIPDFSENIWKSVALLLLLNCISGMYIIFERFYQRNSINIIFFITQMDLFCIFLFGVVWRLWGAKSWFAFFLVLIIAASAFIGHKYRKTILQEAISPRTKAGKMILIVGFIGPTAASCLAYFGGKLLGSYIGSDLSIKILSFAFLPVAIYLIVVSHSISLRIEHPNWKPKK